MIKTGLENFLDVTDKYKNRRIAIIANQTSVNKDLFYIWDILKEKTLNLRLIFSPEHGLFSTEQDQDAVKVQPDAGCEVISLYGDSYDSLIPDRSCLDDIDLVVFDIQDVGARYYTYVNTMALFMKAVENRDIEMLVLDRPNPLGGKSIEGPLLNKEYRSFVGIMPVTIVHGMTAGELALMYKDSEKIDIKLNVIKMKGWKRSMLFPDTGLPWVPPSPNMPTVDTACLYPGGCLIEGVNLSEGRGTTLPFKQIGAPFVDAYMLTGYLNSMNLPGVHFRPVYFKPTSNKYCGETAGGAYIHITDRSIYKAFFSGVAIVKAVYDLYGEKLVFAVDVYEFNNIHPAFDLLTGGPNIREMILKKCTLEEIRKSWEEDEIEFNETRKQFLLY